MSAAVSNPDGKRYRRFRVASRTLTRGSITEALARPNVVKFAGIVHNMDYGVYTHCHAVFALQDARSLATAANMLAVPTALVRPVIGQRGDPYSFARAVRYLTHESPTEQAKGKHRYSDDEVFASEGYDWRAEVDGLRAREGDIPSLLDRVRLDVLQGRRSARSVLEEFPVMFIKHRVQFEQLEESAIFHGYASAELREARLDERGRRWRSAHPEANHFGNDSRNDFHPEVQSGRAGSDADTGRRDS